MSKNNHGQWYSDRHGLKVNLGECLSFAERCATFWALVDKGGPNGCWLWMGRRDKNGYGHFQYNGKPILAHRFAWLATHGSFPEKPFLCHDCDNPPCCNPAHLFPGTNADNVADKMKKGRYWVPTGTEAWHSKLSKDDVLEILNSTLSSRKTGLKFGVNKTSILEIRRGRTYKNIYRLWLDSKTEAGKFQEGSGSTNQRLNFFPPLGPASNPV